MDSKFSERLSEFFQRLRESVLNAKEVSRLKKLAAQGDIAAQVELAERLDAGDAVRRNVLKASEWYRKAARQGSSHAAFRLAMRSPGTSEDLEDYRTSDDAFKWLLRAASMDHMNAGRILRMMPFDVLMKRTASFSEDDQQMAAKAIGTVYEKPLRYFGLRGDCPRCSGTGVVNGQWQPSIAHPLCGDCNGSGVRRPARM